MEEALSSSALASTVDPSGALSNTRQVISKELDFNLMAVQEVIFVGSLELGLVGALEGGGASLGVSTCNRVWCGLWHFLYLWMDLQFLTKWPGLRQFKHRLCSFRVDTLLSCGSALNLVQANRGCFSPVQSTH